MALFSPKSMRLSGRQFRYHFACLTLLFVGGCSTTANNRSVQSPDIPVTADAVNINKASSEELQTLPGIGAKRALKIIQHRSLFGRFRKPSQLMLVDGIGEKQFLKIRHLIKTE